MSDMTLVMGTKTYSSWSLRPWLALKMAGAAFDEVVIPLRQADTKARILEVSPSGHVPLLTHGGLKIWDSLAICDYAAELFPAAGLWPDDRAARATARAISAEMHTGFVPLRQQMPMHCQLRERRAPSPETAANIARIAEIWRGCRAAYGQGGDFLFGRFTIADAMYAPVVSRFQTYDVDLDPACAAYRDAVLALPALQDWMKAAAAEQLPDA